MGELVPRVALSRSGDVFYAKGRDVIDIELITGHALLERCELQQVGVIQIDVEGHEAQVLFTVQPFIEKFRPHTILFECFDNLTDRKQRIRQFFDSQDHGVRADQKWLLSTRHLPLSSETPLPPGIDTYLARSR